MEYKWYKDRPYLSILLIECFASYAGAINVVSSPYLANDFILSQSEVAAMFGWLSVGLLGTLYFSKVGDRIGRRKLVLISLLILWVISILSIVITTYLAYVCIQIVMTFSVGTIFATCPVMITEYVPEQYRARAQSIAAFMGFSGGGWVILLMPLYATTELGWHQHWVYVAAALPFVIGYAIYALRETDNFLQQEENSDRATWRGLLKAGYTIPLVCASFLSVLAISAGGAYFYYYLITIREQSQLFVSLISIAAGCIGVMGLALGAYLSNRLGRVLTIIFATLVLTCATLGFYSNWGEGILFTFVLFVTYSTMLTAHTTRDVTLRMLSTELYPTHLRSTYAGVLAFIVAIAVVASHFSATILTELTGRIEIAVMILTLLTIPALLLFILVPETKGLDIDAPDWQIQGKRLIDKIRDRSEQIR
jgi:MFS family permease